MNGSLLIGHGRLKMTNEKSLQEKIDLAHQEGRDAYFAGKKSEDNPYNGIDDDYEYDAWKEGYYNAAWDE